MSNKNNIAASVVMSLLIITVLIISGCAPAKSTENPNGTTIGNNTATQDINDTKATEIQIEKNQTQENHINITQPLNNNSSNEDNNNTENNNEIQPALKFEGVQSVEAAPQSDKLLCQYSEKLNKSEPIIVNDPEVNLKFELSSIASDNKTADININDGKTITVQENAVMKINLENEKSILFTISLIRDGYTVICVNTNADYNIALCEGKIGSDRFLCFDNLGYLNGIDYCEKITSPDDKANCIGGASGTNG